MSDSITLRLELLKMARELVINEYIDRRAQDHNLWVAQSDELLRTRGLRLQYPEFPPYPTEKDIIARADALVKFMNSPTDEENTEKTNMGSTLVSQPIEVSNKEIAETVPAVSVPVPVEKIEPVVVDTPTREEVLAKIEYTSSVMEIFNKTENVQPDADEAAEPIADPVVKIFNDDPADIKPVEATISHLNPIVKIFKEDTATKDLLPIADTEIARKITEYEMAQPKSPNSLASSIIPNWLLKKQQVKT